MLPGRNNMGENLGGRAFGREKELERALFLVE
jgi:hypothetical protein